jgi:hypothetical protein
MGKGARRDGRKLQECPKMNVRPKLNSFINREELRKIWKMVLEGTVC